MDINLAAEILSRHKFRGVEWAAFTSADGISHAYAKVDDEERIRVPYHTLTEFEAVAIARELGRDAGRDMPATRALLADLRSSFEHMDKFHGKRLDQEMFLVDRNATEAALAEWETKA